MPEALLGLPAIDAFLACLGAIEERARLLDFATCLLDVDILGADGVVDEHDRAILLHLEVARPCRERVDGAARHPHADLAGLQHRHERSVTGQDADLAVGSGHDEHVRLALEGRSFGRHDREVERAPAALTGRHRLVVIPVTAHASWRAKSPPGTDEGSRRIE
jgi:hypothetical protein